MKKRVIIVHGWEGYPEDCWFPWLKRELELHGFEVIIPKLPHPEVPEIKSWVMALGHSVGVIDGSTYFVGHSIGCQTILRYLAILPEGQKVGGAVFVAGFFNLMGLETDEEKAVAGPWLNTAIDFEKVRSVVSKSIAIFSDNDEWVSLDNQNVFRDKLGSEIIIEHNMGHFDRANKIFEISSVLNAILEISL